MEQLGVGNAMCGEVLWHTECASAMATATTGQNQTPK